MSIEDFFGKTMKKFILPFLLFLVLSAAAQDNRSVTTRPSTGETVPQEAVQQAGEELAQVAEEKVLSLFGTQLLQHLPTGESLLTGGVLPADYVLGPGDHLGIFLGGKAQEHFDVVVSTDGKIYVPTVGVFNVSGITFSVFQVQLDQRLQRFYSNYTLHVMLINPKNVRISVIGEVVAPGNYTLSALNSILDAVLVARAVTETGSLRDIQLYRHDELVFRFDAYDYLLNPLNRSEIYLHNGDRLFIPVRHDEVQVTGEVNRPAIYELCPFKKESLADILQLAGGLTDIALTDRIELSRLLPTGRRSVSLIDFESEQREILLQHEDRIYVYSKAAQLPERVVTIWGEVKNPGEYLLEENMRLSDLILRAGNLLRSAYMLQAEVAKVDPNTPVRTIKIDLLSVVENPRSEQNILLDTDDQVFIRRIPEWQVGPVVEIRGEVVFPGFYPIVRDSTTLFEVLTKTGGFTEDAHVQEASLSRRREPVVEDKEFERLKEMTRDQMSDLEYEYFVMKQNTADVREIVVDFQALMLGGEKDKDVVLEDGDLITIPKKPRAVLVTGRVSKPGGIMFRPDADLRYYIDEAGGFTWDADKKRIKVIKVTGEIKEDEDNRGFFPGDRIWVPRQPDRNYWLIFRDLIMVTGQIAAIYLVILTAIDRRSS